ncbi:low-density lipoprotein receptor-related protein-like [Paramacrobiotus metropolitanus]|uniref:low-density lipoprotein receptor-related protein-like n=1 Tax=Paramacrobiotus metropolitanus TaxID=2943436 RepID=UPI0024460769|nr:low-density lipoprotein receptor-related protein-like [Paramacrobiotus metropolitanus]
MKLITTAVFAVLTGVQWTVSVNVAINCSANEFQCNLQQELNSCINRKWVCDGNPDCVDGQDEKQPGCPPIAPCGPGQYQCANGLCISSLQECDHENDCGDRSDEHKGCIYSPCEVNEGRCSSGSCIPSRWLCDGDNDCRDGSDERNCTTSKCNDSSSFQCSTGECMPLSAVCNKLKDCKDASDEIACENQCLNSTNHQCSHICVNMPARVLAAYRCACNSGYALLPDGKGCRDINECFELPGACDQYCYNTPGSYKCSCNTTFYTQTGPTSCKRLGNEETWLLFSDDMFLSKISTNENRSLLTIKNNIIREPSGFDVAIAKGTVYFMVRKEGRISKVNITKLDGVDRREDILFHKPNSVDYVAVDWVTEKIYWTNNNEKTLEVAQTDGTLRNILLRYGLDKPRAIAVHPGIGYVYLTDWGNIPFIARIGMDGTMFERIIASKLVWPNALTIDYIGERIIWGDSQLHAIEMAQLDGKNRIKILPVSDVVSLAVFEGWVYWSDRDLKAIMKAQMFVDTKGTMIQQSARFKPEIKIWNTIHQPNYTNPCVKNGGCSHLCLISPKFTAYAPPTYRCLCPKGFKLQPDNHTCTANCYANQFQCGKPDEKCIDKLWECDGEKDCKDGSDEGARCPARFCEAGRLQCNQRFCVNASDICDGTDDCGDGSDEMLCDLPCEEGQFKCKTGNCISDRVVCNGKNNCGDNSDEILSLCKAKICDAVTEFKCRANGRCIPATWYCDGDYDCSDGSDEPRIVCGQRGCSPGWSRCLGTPSSYKCVSKSVFCDGRRDCPSGWDELPERCPDCTESVINVSMSVRFRCANKSVSFDVSSATQ